MHRIGSWASPSLSSHPNASSPPSKPNRSYVRGTRNAIGIYQHAGSQAFSAVFEAQPVCMHYQMYALRMCKPAEHCSLMAFSGVSLEMAWTWT